MKAFTDISQSKILAKILPIESADMFYLKIPNSSSVGYNYSDLPYFATLGMKDNLPAWSLAALLELIQDDIKIEKTLFDQSDLFTYSILSDTFGYRTYEHEELIDACVEMIIKLKEKGLI